MTGPAGACFHEAYPGVALARRAFAEGVGTMFLMFAASSSGIAAAGLFPGRPGMISVLTALAVGGALSSLVIALGKLSGGHFNPLITLVQAVTGERSVACSLAYIASQLAGGFLGGGLAVALWHIPPTAAGGMGLGGIPSEFVASAGLMLVVLGSSRSGRPESGPFAVGAWLVAAVIGTPTHSYANPALVLGAVFSAGPIALGLQSAAAYIEADLAGAAVALGITFALFPARASRR